MSELVLSGLVKRRAVVSGEIKHTHERLRKLLADLEHLDATIHQFDPHFEVEGIRAKPFRHVAWMKRGELTRAIFSVLRQSDGMLTPRQIARELLISQGVDPEDGRAIKSMGDRVQVVLRMQRERGLLRSEPGPGKYLVWGIVR